MKTTWMHLRTKHWHYLDYVCMHLRELTDVLHTWVMCRAVFHTDHSFVRSMLSYMLNEKSRRKKIPLRSSMSEACAESKVPCSPEEKHRWTPFHWWFHPRHLVGEYEIGDPENICRSLFEQKEDKQWLVGLKLLIDSGLIRLIRGQLLSVTMDNQPVLQGQLLLETHSALFSAN